VLPEADPLDFFRVNAALKFDMLSDSATLQSTQWIINAHYNQRLLSLLDLTTKYEANSCVTLPNACRRSVR
jgi:hypothetical protein